MNDPALFASAFHLETHGGRYMAEEFAEELGKMSGRCIDIGSGSGCALVRFILPKLDPKSTLVCSDISESMVNFAKTTYGGDARLSFAKLNIATQNLPDDLVGQFEQVTSFYCLHWCRDIRQAFENMFTLLRPGGTVLLNFLSHSPAFDSWDDLAAMPQYQPYMKDRSSCAPVFQFVKRPTETLRKVVKDAGFEIGHLSERQVTHIYNSQDAVIELLLSVNPFIERMPADLKEEYKKDLVQEFLKKENVYQKYNTNNECSTLSICRMVVVYLKKPSSC